LPDNCRTIAVDPYKTYIIGGVYITEQKQTCEYCFKNETVIGKKDMIQGRYEFGIAFDSKSKCIYVFGGLANRLFLDHCEKYSVENNTWTPI